MSYTVVYDPDAEYYLADVWMRAPDRKAVAIASNEIDRLLNRSPERCGQQIGPYRRLVIHPLAVEYSVSPMDRIVRVYRVEFLS